MDLEVEYADFIRFYEEAGYEFPCTADQFRARIAAYLDPNDPESEEQVRVFCELGGVADND